jgi:hypothetical protein
MESGSNVVAAGVRFAIAVTQGVPERLHCRVRAGVELLFEETFELLVLL